MLAISVEFLHGTFRADPNGTANTGRLTRGEWPPSPSRLFAALVAADGTRQQCSVTDGSELAWLEGLPPPAIHAHSRPHHQPLQPRYVAAHGGTLAKGSHQEYVGRSGATIRPGVRVAPRAPHLVYVWDGLPSDKHLEALRRRAARVGYLGASDSPARLRATTAVPTLAEDADAYLPDSQGDLVINVTKPGDLETLDRLFDAWREHGASVSRTQFPALRHGVRYRSPNLQAPTDRGEVVAWLRLESPISGRRVSMVTALFKAALLSQHERIHGEPDRVLHGHGFTKRGYETARYLALPDVGYRWSRGLIRGLALWLPPECDATVRRTARDAALAIRHLSGPGIDVAVTQLSDTDTQPAIAAIDPRRWLRASKRWATAFPAVHERRRVLDLGEVARWCSHAGLPTPIGFRAMRTPMVPGAVDLAPVEVNRPDRPKLPYSHVGVRFAEAVPGPVVMGSGRQRGLGLCVQVDGPE